MIIIHTFFPQIFQKRFIAIFKSSTLYNSFIKVLIFLLHISYFKSDISKQLLIKSIERNHGNENVVDIALKRFSEYIKLNIGEHFESFETQM